MNANELKLLTGAKTKMQAINILCQRLEKRTYSYAGYAAKFAGYDDKKDLVHFTQTEATVPGSCWHRRIYLRMDDAIDCITGNLDNAPVMTQL